ncbi:MAG: hypothetical protein FNP40_05675 [Dehalobacter sp. 4CP]|nr:hypothetical protein [Dehalobacter sp. 4CP]
MWSYWDNLEGKRHGHHAMAGGDTMPVNEGLSSDFFASQRPRLLPWSDEQYRNAPKREREQAPPWQEHWHAL